MRAKEAPRTSAVKRIATGVMTARACAICDKSIGGLKDPAILHASQCKECLRRVIEPMLIEFGKVTYQLSKMTDHLTPIASMVVNQKMDANLWRESATVEYLQKELRHLHRVVETGKADDNGKG